MENKPEGFQLYADLEGARVNINGGTIPLEIIVSTSRPDLAIVNSNTSPTTVILLELTMPFTANIDAANAKKGNRYQFVTSDIQEAGFTYRNLPLKVESRGQLTPRKREKLIYIYHTFKVRKYQQIHINIILTV